MTAVPLPQRGGCLCGEVRYALREDPVAVYACHCSDCQTESGSAFHLAVVVATRSLEWTGTQPEPWQVTLADGRSKGALHCTRCKTNLGAADPDTGLSSIDGGSFDDTSWIRPAGHIWTRSAQPWIQLPESGPVFAEAPGPDGFVAIARAWKERAR